MNGHFAITYKATTETGKTFYYNEHMSFPHMNNILRELRTIEGTRKGIKYTIEADGLFQFKTKKEAVDFAYHNNQGAEHNGTGLTAFLKEIGF